MATYYIKPFDKNYQSPHHQKFFDAEIKNLEIDEKNNDLWISGKYLCYNNANLPNFSYYLNVISTLANLENINLIFIKRKKVDFHDCFIDEYNFSFLLNLERWSNFNNYLSNAEFNFDFITVFNQNVVKDFNIDVSTENLQNFIYEINKLELNKSFLYSNYYEIKNNTNYLDLNNFKKNQDVIKINNNFQHNLIIKSILDINSINPMNINLIKATTKLNFINDENKINHEEVNVKLTETNDIYSIVFSDWYEYDYTNNNFIQEINDTYGLFSTKNLNLQINFEADFMFNSLKRKISFSNNFNFQQNKINDLLNNNFKYTNLTNFFSTTKEVWNE